MYPYADSQTMLDLHRRHADELRREAAAYRVARTAARLRRVGRRGRHAGHATLS
jgi:hypothetical protein